MQATIFEWREDSEIWLLSLLQEGLGRRLPDVTSELRDAVEALLRPRWEGGGHFGQDERAQVRGPFARNLAWGIRFCRRNGWEQ
jgi:hypothetical protein